MKTILATTYAVNPYKGSEDGMGWNFIYQIARYNKVIAITRENNRPYIEKYMQENPDYLYENITFLYYDLAYWMRFWKKGSRGAMLYYWMWQRMLPSFIKKQNIDFDIVHNVNFHNDWTPSYLWKLNKPFVWGPVGHHPLIPSAYLKGYKKSYLIKDRLTWLVKKYFWKVSPSLKQTVKHSNHIICMNQSVPEVLKMQNNYSIAPSVATQDFGFDMDTKKEKFTLITAGRLVPLKGFDLTISSFAGFINNLNPSQREKCELVIVGSGPELPYYKQMADKYHVGPYVKFIEWIERNQLMNLFKKSSAFIFPSHEGAGMVVAEALSFGLPVICLKNCGPGEFINESCGVAVSYEDYDQTINELSGAITTLFNIPGLLKKMSIHARKHFESTFSWDVRGEQLRKIYLSL